MGPGNSSAGNLGSRQLFFTLFYVLKFPLQHLGLGDDVTDVVVDDIDLDLLSQEGRLQVLKHSSSIFN